MIKDRKDAIVVERGSEFAARLAPWLKHGPGAAALRLSKRALSRWVQWGSLVFFEQPLLGAAETDLNAADARAGADPRFEIPAIRELQPGDLAAAARAFGRDLGKLAARVSRGDRAFGLFDATGAAPLHLRWATSQATRIPEAGLWLRPREGEVYLYDVMTHPLYRGGRISGTVRATMDRALWAQGFRTKIGYVRGDNRAMLRSIERAGVEVRRLFEVQYLTLANRAPLIFGRYEPPVYRTPG